jgi:probable blue pigment (indigoidine) exporter
MPVTRAMGRLTPRNLLIAACAPVLWGTMPSVASQAITPGHPLLIATTRSLCGGLLILLAFRRLPPRSWYWRILTLGTVNIALVFALFFISAARVQGGIIAVLMSLSPFWAALVGWPLLGERPQTRRFVLIGVGIIGISLLVKASAGSLDPGGVLAGIAASCCMGCGVVLVKKWGRPAPLLVFAGWQLLVGGLLLTALTLATEGLPPRLTGSDVAGLSYLVLIATVAAYPAWFSGIERIGAQRTAMLLLLVPVVAFVIDVSLLGKQLTGVQVVGLLIVFACLILDQRTPSVVERT